jgi:hypothetical protein
MQISVKVEGVEELTQRFNHLLPQQIQFSALKAIDRLADKTKSRLFSEMHSVFDRPTPYTLGALRMTHPSMSNLSAEVGFKDLWSKRSVKYLTPQVEGGGRGVKGFELMLQQRVTVTNLRGGFSVYPKGTTFVPGPGARMDVYGNMSPGQIQQIIAGLRAMTDMWSNTTRRSKARNKRTGVYVATPKAIWFVDKGKMVPLLIVTKTRPMYRKRFDFYEVARAFVQEHFLAEFEQALSERTVR